MLVSIDSPPPPLQYLCFLSFRTVVKGYLNLGNSQSNMSSPGGCYAFFLFEETKYTRVPILYFDKKTSFLGLNCYSRWPNPGSAAFRQVPKQVLQGEYEKKVPVMDDTGGTHVYSCWEKENAVKKPCSMLHKAVLEGDPTGDAKKIISYLRHLQCA